MNGFLPRALLIAFLLGGVTSAAETAERPRLDWQDLFGRLTPTKIEFSAGARALEGKRVRLRGYALFEPRPEGALFLTRTPEGRLHPDDEETLPWDAVAVIWRKGLELPPVPRRPTVEGTLRLGNRKLGGELVIVTLEDAVPALDPASELSDSGASGRR